MESIVYLLVLAPAILFLILKFDTKQNRKISKVLKETKNLQPLFLMRSVEQKIVDLNNRLYGNVTYHGHQLGEAPRQLLAEQLGRLTAEYNNKQITLQDYNTKLGKLIQTIEQVKFINFETVATHSPQQIFN